MATNYKKIKAINIEEEFFKVFGIDPRDYYSCSIDSYCPYNPNLCDENCPYYIKYKTAYPEITEDILLELICILNKFTGYTSLFSDSCQGIKEEILKNTLFVYKQLRKSYKLDLKHQVCSLFKRK